MLCLALRVEKKKIKPTFKNQISNKNMEFLASQKNQRIQNNGPSELPLVGTELSVGRSQLHLSPRP